MLCWLMLVGCVAPSAPATRPIGAPGVPRFDTELGAIWAKGTRDNGLNDPRFPGYGLPWGGRMDEGLATPAGLSGVVPAPGRQTVLGKIATTVEDADIDTDRGDALAAALDAEDPDVVAANGLGVFTSDELFGEAGLCEAPSASTLFDVDGEQWKASLEVVPYVPLINGVVALPAEVSEDCSAGLLAAGDIDAAVEAGACDEATAHAFFGEADSRTACGACVEDAGDFAACVDAGSCDEQVQAQQWVEEDSGRAWYDVMGSVLWACAPDYTMAAYILGDVSDTHEVPAPFDHAGYAYICTLFFDEATGEPGTVCISGDGSPATGDTVGEGILGYLRYDRPRSEDQAGWKGRPFYVDSFVMQNGATIDAQWLYTPGMGSVSEPHTIPDTNGDGVADLGDTDFGFGWAVSPYALRPDGTDADEPDDTFAPDWIAWEVMKGSTTRSGVPVAPANHNRCAADGWAGPAADGSYYCAAPEDPVAGWGGDGINAWQTESHTIAQAFPMLTLVSSGAPDADVPGGFAIAVAGTDRLANPDWDACAWPTVLVPDQIALQSLPDVWPATTALTADTWRLDRDDGFPVRAMLSTNQTRGFCPADGDGVGAQPAE
jgi:hypothetical protein